MRIDERRDVSRHLGLSGVWVVLYSQIQRAVHVERLDEFIAKEVEEILSGRDVPRYRLVHAGWSEEETRDQAARWQQSRSNREI